MERVSEKRYLHKMMERPKNWKKKRLFIKDLKVYLLNSTPKTIIIVVKK